MFQVASWQDAVFLIGNVVFLIALFPAIFGKFKPPASTCFLTGAWLWVYLATFLTLGLPASALGSLLTASGWTVLFLQSWRGK